MKKNDDMVVDRSKVDLEVTLELISHRISYIIHGAVLCSGPSENDHVTYRSLLSDPSPIYLRPSFQAYSDRVARVGRHRGTANFLTTTILCFLASPENGEAAPVHKRHDKVRFLQVAKIAAETARHGGVRPDRGI